MGFKLSKILIINPVGTYLWDDITLQAVKKIVNPDTEVIVRSLKGAPPAIECDYDRDLAVPYVINEVIRASKEGFDAIVINCFDDPGLHAAREVTDVLVLGIGETTITAALLLGYRIAIISTGKHSRNVYYRRAVSLGIADRVVYTSGIDVEVLDLRKDLDKVKSMLVEEINRAVKEYGAEVIVLGCGGFLGLAEELSKDLGIPVLDPTLTTVKIAEALIKLGLKHSKIYLFNRLKHPY